MRKAIVFVVLGIPVLIAIILKLFGDNQFEIPIYYEEGVSSEECEVELKEQYFVADFQTQDGNIYSLKNEISLVYFHFEENSDALQMKKDLQRIFSTKLESGLLNMYAISNPDHDFDNMEEVAGITFLQMETEKLEQFARCALFLPSDENNEKGLLYSTAILIDRLGRIRGYYNGSDEKEMDRLSAEVDILQLDDTDGQ